MQNKLLIKEMNRILLLLLLFSFHYICLKGQNALFIPPLDTGYWNGNVRTFDLNMQDDSTEFISGIYTQTAGYNGSFLGPTLYIKKHDSVVLNVTNGMDEVTTTHWHGLHVPAIMDGGPMIKIMPGNTWVASFKMMNQASTFWYHPHHKPTFWQDSDGTGGQIFRGLAGMLIVEDENTDSLSLPCTYGIDEIPLIIQDRSFGINGEFLEFINPLFIGRPGDTILVNGTLNAELQTHAQMIRLRILNASNTRTYYFGFDDNRSFMQIGSDGGLLEQPISLDRLRLSPAERAEIVVDFSSDQGQIINLMSYAGELRNILLVYAPALLDKLDTTNYKIMSFNVGAPTSSPVTSISQNLNTITLYNELDADTSRTFVLDNGPPMTINGVSMDMAVINEIIPLGNLEVWTINNSSGTSHPFHIHGEPFQVLARSDGPVPENEKGWKDVVLVPLTWPPGNDGWVKIIKPFNDFADSTYVFMYHCHILEHEDAGMMGSYIVVDSSSSPLSLTKKTNTPYFSIFPNPATNIIRFSFLDKISDDYIIEIKNHLGQVAKQSTKELSLDVSELSTGIYFISVQSNNFTITKKLIIH